MLSRPARAVFHLGRHVERADGAGRLINLHLPLLDAAEPSRDDALVRDLLLVTGAADHQDGDAWASPLHAREGDKGARWTLLDRLGYDETSPASVLGAWAAARASAHAAREVLPAQVVEVLDASAAAVPPTRWRGRDPDVFLAWVRERTAVVTGSADMSCPRDEAWWFLRLGAALERASASSLLVASAALHDPVGQAATAPGPRGHHRGEDPRAHHGRRAGLPRAWRALMDAAGAPSSMTARTTTPAGAGAAVLLDRGWPRSVVAAIAAAEEALDGLEALGVRTETLDAPRQRLVRVRTALEYRPVETTLGDVDALVRQVRRSASAVVRSVEETCLEPAAPASWLVHAG